MALFITSLNSGSNGNCYYIGNDREAILVDAGISCRETEKRMKRLGLSMDKVRAIFVSHEHSDHIRGIPVLAKKFRLPVYITEATLQHGGLQLEKDRVMTFRAFEPVSIGELVITPFPKLHDAADPYSFTITGEEVTIGVFTDIGLPCTHVINYFQQCHAVFLETNYDEDMLEQGAYPWHLKNRIRGGKGHLSNKQALQLFVTHKPAFLSLLLLSHLSRDNNSPALVQELFDDHADGATIVVASRYEETEVYAIDTAGHSNYSRLKPHGDSGKHVPDKEPGMPVIPKPAKTAAIHGHKRQTKDTAKNGRRKQKKAPDNTGTIAKKPAAHQSVQSSLF